MDVAYTFSKVSGIRMSEVVVYWILLRDLYGLIKYFFSSDGVGQYSIPLRFVIHRQAPALLSSLISSIAPS